MQLESTPDAWLAAAACAADSQGMSLIEAYE